MEPQALDQTIALIEAILFVAKESVEPGRIMEYLQISDIDELEKILAEMDKRYQEAQNGRGIFIKRTGGGLQLLTRPEFHDHLSTFFSVRQALKLTVPSLETLAIVAYRQPVTLAEISHMRSVNSCTPVQNLLHKKLIKIAGRKKVPGLPMLYGTSKEFLTYFGLNDLSELPSLEELAELFDQKEQPSLFK